MTFCVHARRIRSRFLVTRLKDLKCLTYCRIWLMSASKVQPSSLTSLGSMSAKYALRDFSEESGFSAARAGAWAGGHWSGGDEESGTIS
jgi:hypothetical protein